MAFDQTTRNRLARFVSDARSLLTEEFTRQLQNEYGLDPATGDVTDLARLKHLDDSRRETARLLRETMEHYLSSANTGTPAKAKKARQEALDRIVREQAFTVLNRLCALRMSEARGLLVESIAKGYQSKGFQLYQRLAGTALGGTGGAYSVFLFSVFDEFAVDLPVLFDRFSPQGRLFPRETALLAVLEQINHADIDPLWAEDETIGWIYQYFNSVEERREMRTHGAPRNSRELAVRNQFFTPRYVVEFLTDNTLGRIWYEMTKGNTALKDSCRYLVRRPNEVFLAEGEEAPEQEEPAGDLSQEELLKQPVYIAHRSLKDPRDIKMLDPACGSMHFGLYAFDLFERIYDEAWDLESQHADEAFVRPEGLKPLHETYDGKEAFLRDVPRLIIERNIHGIDIDPRAVQIAGLSLWLRAQKSWQGQGLKPQGRPQIQRSNIVCAEPMPGEADMLEEFLKSLRDDRLESLIRRVLDVPENQRVRATGRMAEALCDLVRTVWKEMQLAGEAGSLLKIEESLADAIVKGKEEWVQNAPLFRVMEFGLTEESRATPKVKYYKTVPGGEDDFWNRAEAMVLAALEEYAEHASSDQAFRKRLFAGDAARGFALIDVCRTKVDVALMNPPFGSFAISAREYAKQSYDNCKEDIDAAFVSRAFELLVPDGRLGVIANRTQLFKPTLSEWRRLHLIGEGRIRVAADLGHGVLDDAMVEAACYVTERTSVDRPAVFARLLRMVDRSSSLLPMLQELRHDEAIPDEVFVVDPIVFQEFPEFRVPYWASGPILRAFLQLHSLGEGPTEVKQGLVTADDFRFVRLAWEVPERSDTLWRPFAKGGEYAPYCADIHLVVNWGLAGEELSGFGRGRVQNSAYYFRPGITWSVRTASGFSPRALPKGCIFSHTGDIAWTEDRDASLAYLAILMSRVVAYMVEMMVASGDAVVSGTAARSYEVGVVRSIPVPSLTSEAITTLSSLSKDIWRAWLESDCTCETSRYYCAPAALCLAQTEAQVPLPSKGIVGAYESAEDRSLSILRKTASVEVETRRLYQLDSRSLKDIADEFGPHPCELDTSPLDDSEALRLMDAYEMSMEDLITGIVAESGGSRAITKKCYFADRQLELLAAKFGRAPEKIVHARRERMDVPEQYRTKQASLVLSHLVGVAFGRWRRNAVSRSMLDGWQSHDLLPTSVPAAATNEMNMPAVLVDDSGHSSNLVLAVREAISDIWGSDRLEQVEQDLCHLLAVPSLDRHLTTSRFFAEHLSQYSQSRRTAPIYWPLSTRSGSYTLWLYYHRLTDQTLYTCVNDFIEPKLKQVAEETNRLRGRSNRSPTEERELERLSDLELQLKDFRDELLRIAEFWKPDLNDGVAITAAPLWKLFQHRQWQARLKETWEKLEAGEYDWAHLALSIWPDRVVRASHKDRSYAIAHDLEDKLWQEVQVGTDRQGNPKYEWQPKYLTEMEMTQIIAEAKAR